MQESGHLLSGSQADNSPVHPSQMAYLYWEAKAQGFSDLRRKLFAVAFLKFLFTGIGDVNVSYSTTGCDSYLTAGATSKMVPLKVHQSVHTVLIRIHYCQHQRINIDQC